MSEPYVLGIGAANIDVHGKSRVPIVMRDSNPGHLRTSAGGVTRNVLENLARLGVRTKLISAVGADLYGEMVLRSSASAGIDISGVVGDLETQLADWSVGALLGLWFQSVFVGLCTQILSICIFLVIYGRMIEVYLVTSIGPIPFATMVNREWGSTGQNYLRSLLALGFQAFLIMISVGIYAVLVEGISTSGDNISAAIWGCMGYTVLLCYTLFKTGSLAKSLFGAH